MKRPRPSWIGDQAAKREVAAYAKRVGGRPGLRPKPGQRLRKGIVRRRR